MSSENLIGAESNASNTSNNSNSCATSVANNKHDKLDKIIETFLSGNISKDNSILDNFEQRFMEELCKERDTSEGWDKYLDMLREVVTNEDNKTINVDSNSKPECESKRSSLDSRSTKLPSNKPKAQQHSPQKKQEQFKRSNSKDEDKKVHYFRNGTCYWGNPDADEHIKKKPPQVDVSEQQFYRNLRAYFGTDTRPHKPGVKEKQSAFYQKWSCDVSESSNREPSAEQCSLEKIKQNRYSCDTTENIETANKMPSKSEKISSIQSVASHVPITEGKVGGCHACNITRDSKQVNKTTSREILIENKLRNHQANANYENGFNEHGNTFSHVKTNIQQESSPNTKCESNPSVSQRLSCGNGVERSFKDELLERPKDCQETSVGFVESTDMKDDKPISPHNISPLKETQSQSTDKENECSSVAFSSEKTTTTVGSNEGTQPPKRCEDNEIYDNKSQPSSDNCPPEQRKKDSKHPAKEKHKSYQANKEKTTQAGKEYCHGSTQNKQHENPQFNKNHPKSQTVSSSKTDKKTKKSQRMHGDASQSKPTSNQQKERDESELPPYFNKEAKREIFEAQRALRHKARAGRHSKEEMIGRISSNETSEALFRRLIGAAKDISWKCFKGLLWSVYYTMLITAIISLCLLTLLKGAVVYIYGYIMSLGGTIVIIDKIWTGKLYLVSWYNISKEFVREKLYGPKRGAQTYNLPNSGHDAVQMLLMRQGPDNDPYRILGVPKEATGEDVRKQYRKFAVLVHPDKNKHPEAAKAFQILTSAYDILGDTNKRQAFDKELARKEQQEKERASGTNFMKDPSDYTNPQDFFVDFMKQMEEIRESLSCNACGGRHKRIQTKRSIFQARFCSTCATMHQAKEGDFWKESNGILGMGAGKFYTRMENAVYDITEWGLCQQERGDFRLPPNTHRVCGKINSQRNPPPARRGYTEDDFLRDLFRQNGDLNHGQQHHREQQNKAKQQKRRRKKK